MSGHLPRRLALLGGTTTPADVAQVVRHLASPGLLVDGPSIREFEAAFAAVLGVDHAVSFSAGRVGLYGILKSLGIGPGDEILVQVPTHIVVPNAIRYLGARPVYTDCELETYNMDLDAAEAKVTSRTRALLVQHTFGIPVDMVRARTLADKYGLALIEDCVHALGSTHGGQPIGSMGTASFFSTEETKTISTTMGGMVATNDADLARRLVAFQSACRRPTAYQTAKYLVKLAVYHCLTQPTIHVAARRAYEMMGRRHPLPRPTQDAELRGERPRGYARRLSNGQAALGLSQLRTLAANLEHRRRVADLYRRLLTPSGLRLPTPPLAADTAYVRFPVWVEDREAAIKGVDPRAVLGTWFTTVLEEAVSPEAGGYVRGECPRAESAAKHLVNLPTHRRVTVSDAEAIVGRLVASQA